MSGRVEARFDVIARAGGTYLRRARSTAVERDEHGTLAGYGAGCRCPRCRRARNLYDRTYRAARAVVAGREAIWMVDTGPVRAHIVLLRADGWSVAQIAGKAAVSEMTVRRVMSARRCWSSVAAAICAL